MSDETNLAGSPETNALADDEAAAKSSNLEKIKWYVRLLFGLVVVVNLVAVGVYWHYGKLLEYFDSKSLEGLLISLLIPLLLSLIEKTFKISDKLEADQKQKEHEKKEAQRQVVEARRKRQAETIEKTNAMWSELYRLSTEVAYFKPGQSKVPIREIRKQLECLTSSAEEMLNLWYLHFPEIALEIQGLVLPGLNLLLLSALTVADLVEEQPDDQTGDAAKQMQNCLLVIQDGVRYGLHYSLMQTFHFAMEGQKFDLDNLTVNLRGPGALFKYLLGDQRPNLPSNDLGQAAAQARAAYSKDLTDKCAQPKDAFDALFKKITQATDPKIKQQIMDSQEFKLALAAYQKANQSTTATFQAYQAAIMRCPPGMLGLARKRIFSPAQLEAFTRELFFQSDFMRLQASI